MKAALAAVLGLLAFVWSGAALAFEPPPLHGYVVDAAGVLTPEQKYRLETKLGSERERTGFAVVVFLPASLEGESVEDVAYTTAKTWGVGDKDKDNGVVLVVATKERKIRIETGKGVGGSLPDVACWHIIRDVIAPRMKKGDTFDAVDEGTSSILRALTSGGRDLPAPSADPPGQVGMPREIIGMGIVFVCMILAFFLTRKGGGGSSGSGGSGWTSSSSSSWSSGDSSSSSGGGGGDFGGGGASGDY
jgi:uncharacterized protein